MKAEAIPEEAIPALAAALSDPEVQVRANAALALSRLDALPDGAVPRLIECTAASRDDLRLNAAMALRLARAEAVGEVMEHLLEDPSVRVRLIAAGSMLAENPENARAVAVVMEGLADASVGVRKAALGLVESLGAGAFAEALEQRRAVEAEPRVRRGAGPGARADGGSGGGEDGRVRACYRQ